MTGRRYTLKLLLASTAWLLSPLRARAASLPPEVEAALRDAELIYVATRRKSGALSEISPIWFYYMGDGQLFFSTAPDSWKAKRIAEGSALYIWVGDKQGPFLEGRAVATTDAALIDRMGEAYANKYWIAWLGLFKPRSDRVDSGKTKAYVVTLTHSAPPAS
ncbi:MAG: pyridoxamine 5'-phosphate oxidase family protein [Candidatus Binatia bacterium]